MKFLFILVLFLNLAFAKNQGFEPDDIDSDIEYAKCDRGQLKIGVICKIAVYEINPTQIAVGKLEVTQKSKEMEERDREGKLEKWLTKKIAPVVLGNSGELFITDRHHHSSALLMANVDQVKKLVTIQVIDDLSNLTREEMIEAMTEKKYTYLKKLGEEISFDELPRNLEQLIDDPYRTFAWLVQEAGGFNKVDVKFLEFYWADFFRKKIVVDTTSLEGMKLAVSMGLVLAKSRDARDLPGYIETVVKNRYQLP